MCRGVVRGAACLEVHSRIFALGGLEAARQRLLQRLDRLHHLLVAPARVLAQHQRQPELRVLRRA